MYKYIIVGRDRMAYKRYTSIEIGMNQIFEVTRTIDYNMARIFHSLRWAIHRAWYLTERDSQAYYVYLVIEVDDQKWLYLIDEHQNDDIFAAEDEFQEKIDGILEEWKLRRGAKQ